MSGKQKEQCVERYWAIRIGKHDGDSIPYFMIDQKTQIPLLFFCKEAAEAECVHDYHKPVQVIVSTLGEMRKPKIRLR